MDEAAHRPEVDMADIEMADNFLPRIPTVIVSIKLTWS